MSNTTLPLSPRCDSDMGLVDALDELMSAQTKEKDGGAPRGKAMASSRPGQGGSALGGGPSRQHGEGHNGEGYETWTLSRLQVRACTRESERLGALLTDDRVGRGPAVWVPGDTEPQAPSLAAQSGAGGT